MWGVMAVGAAAAIIVFICSMWLNFAITWTCFGDTFRGLLTDYAVTISVFLVIFLSNMWEVEKRDVPRIEVPTAFAPTCHHDSTHNTSFLDVNYECLCNSHAHCAFVNSVDDDSGGSMAIDSVNGTEHARQWVTSYEARILAYQQTSTLPQAQVSEQRAFL
jgi:hypothetical protein|eukprot:COSAG06_NODE_4812_length_3937_cov_2.416102_5_plen_161_part_00